MQTQVRDKIRDSKVKVEVNGDVELYSVVSVSEVNFGNGQK